MTCINIISHRIDEIENMISNVELAKERRDYKYIEDANSEIAWIKFEQARTRSIKYAIEDLASELELKMQETSLNYSSSDDLTFYITAFRRMAEEFNASIEELHNKLESTGWFKSTKYKF